MDLVVCGCFCDSLAAFKEWVVEVHGNNEFAQQYFKEIKMVEYLREGRCMMKLCKDCRFKWQEFCHIIYMNVVTGEQSRCVSCDTARADENKCGASARYFEAKGETKEEPKEEPKVELTEELEPKPFHLHTYIDEDDNLVVGYYDGADREIVGYITRYGKCHIMNNQDYRENWEVWKEKGMIVYTTSVKWRGREYCINSDRMLKSSVCFGGFIFNFEAGVMLTGCEDNNIQRLSNETPINY